MRRVSERRGVILILCLALLVRLGALLLSDGLQSGEDPDGYWQLAKNLLEHGTFGRGDVPSAYRPPLYPLLLGGCAILGDYGRVAVGILHLLLGLATVGMVFVLARRWGLHGRGTAVAATLVAADPILLAASTQVMTETLATFLATAGLLVLAGRTGDVATKEGGAAESSKIFAGVVLALGVLCRPVFLLWTLAVGAALWWRNCQQHNIAEDNCREPTAPGIIANSRKFPWAFCLGAIVVLSPWAIRNQAQFRRPIVTTTHGGYTLLLANNPMFYDWLRTGRWGSVWRADRFNADWDARRTADEVRADRQAYAETLETIRRQPAMFLDACLVRIGRFWSPLPHRLTADETPLRQFSRYAVAAWYFAEFALALLGILRLIASFRAPASFRRPKSARLWGLLLVGCVFFAHVVYWTDMRMRAPIVPVIAIVAAGGYVSLQRCEDGCPPKKCSL